MPYHTNHSGKFQHFVGGTPGALRHLPATPLLVSVLAAALVMALAAGTMMHAGGPGQAAENPHPDPVASSLLPGYAFAQVRDSTPPVFVSSGLDGTTGVLTITFSEAIDATPVGNIVPAKIHVRESGNYTHGVTLTAGELGTVADGATISFNLNATRLAAVMGLNPRELTIEPGAVRDASGNLIVGTFEASTAAFVGSFSVSERVSGPQGMAFSSDGGKMFVVDGIGDTVNEYALSAPFDTSAAAFVNATSIQSQEFRPTGIAFSSDGAKMFVIGSDGDDVNEYELSAPFDTSTAAFVNATSVSAQGDSPEGIAFSSDGTRMFVVGWDRRGVSEYNLSAPFDTSNATSVGSFSTSTQELFPTGIAFSSDGTKMFVVGIATYSVNEHNLPAPFDIPNATFVDATLISEQAAYPTDIAFSSDGTKMFVLDFTGKDVNEYDLISVYPIVVRNNLPMSVQVGGNQTVGEGDTVPLSGSANDPDGDPITYTWSQTNPATPRITFANAFAPSTTFVAPSVTEDTTFTITLTAHDGTQYAADALNVTVRETGTAFITTWTATNSDRTITLPMTGTYSVLWGNGIYSENVNGSTSYSYDAAGDYTVTVLGGGLESIDASLNPANARQLKSINQWGGTEWTTMHGAFRGALSMTYNATDSPDLSRVTDMTGMFRNARAFNGDLSSWDVSEVTGMTNMFREATTFNGDLSSWDVSGVTEMYSMFYGASSFNQPLSSWNVSGVTGMSSMFYGASSFNQPLSSWNVSGVTGMSSMFYGASSFNQPLDSWNVSSVIGMSSMFYNASSFNQPLDSWNVSSVITMYGMFDDADLFDQNLGTWYVVPADTVFDAGDASLGVTTISAQNRPLRDQNPDYGMGSGGHSDLFNMTGSTLTFINAPTAASYKANVTASGTSVFENGNNWRMLDITVRGGTNNAPTAEAGPDLNVDEGGSVTLQGSGSDDDGDNITYAWSQSPDTPVVTFDDINSATPVVTAPSVTANTTITLTLTVRDGDVPATDTMVLTIRDTTAANLRPTVSVGPDQTVREGAAVSMPWTATDPDGDNITYSWSQSPAQPAITLNSRDSSPTTFTAPPVDADTQFTFTLEVTAGPHIVEDSLTVTVKNNRPPTAEAGPDLNVDEGGSVTLQGSGSDDDGDDITYAWSQDPLLTFDNSSSATPSVTASSVTADTRITLTLTVRDGDVPATDTMVLAIRDTTAANLRPTVSVGPDQTVREGAAVSMPWTAFDPDGDNITYSWSQSPAQPAITLNSRDSSPTTFTAPPVDADTQFTFTLEVTAGPHTAEDSLTVTVKNNRPPVVDAGPDRTVNERASVTLPGSATDPDGDDFTYSWSHDFGQPVTLTNNDTLRPQFTAPGVTSDGTIVFTLTATDTARESADDTATITVRDVSITVSSVVYNSGTITVTFNQDINPDITTPPVYSQIHIRDAGSDSGGIALSDADTKSYSGRTITATLWNGPAGRVRFVAKPAARHRPGHRD